MKIGRTLPPAAAPLCWEDLWHGVSTIFSPGRAIQALEQEVRQHFAVRHLFGVPSDIERIRTLCRARGIFVVEDAAQAMGAEFNGRKLGTGADVGIFSLGRGKNITCGSGGIVLTNSDRIAEAIARHYDKLMTPGLAEMLKDLV